MKNLSSVFLLIGLFAVCASAQYATFNESKVPAVVDRPEQFAPSGWKVEDKTRGDLNRDGKADYAIKFVEDRPVREGEGFDSERVLIVALSDGSKIKRVAISKKLLQCTSCGGAFYGVMSAPANVSIEKGAIVVENEHGSRNVSGSTFRFRYDAKSDRVLLIGYDFSDYDRLDGSSSSESTNYLTNKRVTKTGKGKRTRTKRSAIKPVKIYIEDADGDEIEGQALHRLGLD